MGGGHATNSKAREQSIPRQEGASDNLDETSQEEEESGQGQSTGIRKARPSSRGDSSDSEEDDVDNEMASDEGWDEDDEETGLTHKERKSRRRKKKKRTQLDSRIAGNVEVSRAQEKLADKDVVRRLLFNALLIGMWYV